MKRGQASSEYLPLLAVVLLIALLGIFLLSNFTSGMSDVNIAVSKGYWKSASPLRVDDWAVKGTEPDPTGNGTVQLAMVMSNPTENTVVLRKILVAGMNFTETYSRGTNFAGDPADLTPITFAPGETNTVVIIQLSGPAVKKNYEIDISFLLEDQKLQRSEEGMVPLRGRAELVGAAAASAPPGLGCSIGQTPCNQSGTQICCSSSQICTMKTLCCNPGQVACGLSCCTGSCASGVCIPPGSRYCSWTGAACALNCCPTGCQAASCNMEDLVVEIYANATVLQEGESAEISFVTKNIGAIATGASTTRATDAVGGSPSVLADYAIPALAAGTNSTNSTNITCNATFGVGTHTIAAYADNASAITESDEGNNANSTQIICYGKPDLVIWELRAGQTELAYGQNALIVISTKNNGTDDAGASNTSVISNISASAVSPGSFSITSLSAGLRQLTFAYLSCNAANAGSHRISAYADNLSQVSESNESNNANDSLVINCSTLDLDITSLEVSPSPPIPAGGSATITIKLKNSGGNATGNWTVIPDITVTPAGGALNGTPVIIVPWNGTEVNGTFNFTCDSNLSAQTDYNITVNVSAVPEEANTQNNLKSVIVACAAGAEPDLEMLPLTMVQSILNPLNNKVKTISFSMNNSGGARSGDWSVTASASAVPPGASFGTVPTLTVPKNGTTASGTVDFTCPSGLPMPTIYLATLTAPLQADESNNANNANTISIACYPAAPDIYVESMAATPPSPITVNTGAQVDIVIKNIGDVATGAFNVLLSDTPSGGMLSTNTLAFPAGIDANSQTSTSFTYTCGGTPGNYTITASADVVAGEYNSTNNVLNFSIICNAANTPDLEITSVTAVPEKPATGQQTLVQVWARNVGTAASGAFNATLTNSSGNLSESYKTYSSIAAGGGPDMQSVYYTCPATGGTYNIVATADTLAGETNTQNNVYTYQITCSGVPDLHVMSLSGTTPIYVNNSTSIGIPIRNIGSQASGAFTISISASGGSLSSSSQSYTSIAANSGPSYRSVTFTCPAANGTYTINASAPGVNGEVNTANNWNITNITCLLPGPNLRTNVFYADWINDSQLVECRPPQGCFIDYGADFQFIYVTCNDGQAPSTVTTVTRRSAIQDNGPSILDYGNPYDKSIPPLSVGSCSSSIPESGQCLNVDVHVGIAIYSDYTNQIEGKPLEGFEPGYANYFCRDM